MRIVLLGLACFGNCTGTAQFRLPRCYPGLYAGAIFGDPCQGSYLAEGGLCAHRMISGANRSGPVNLTGSLIARTDLGMIRPRLCPSGDGSYPINRT